MGANDCANVWSSRYGFHFACSYRVNVDIKMLWKNHNLPPRPRQMAITTVLFPDPLLPQIKLMFWCNGILLLLVLIMYGPK
jgi:hypothetical protein